MWLHSDSFPSTAQEKKKKKKGKTYCQRRLVAWLHIKFKYRAGLEIFFSHSKLLLRLIANEALNISRKWYESDDNIGMYDVIYYNSVSYRLKLVFCWRGYTNVIYGAVWLLLDQPINTSAGLMLCAASRRLHSFFDCTENVISESLNTNKNGQNLSILSMKTCCELWKILHQLQ